MGRRPTLLVYAVPAVPLAFLGLPLYVYLPAHYAALPDIGLAVVGMVLLFARLIDLVTDPLVGYVADRTRHRFRPQWLMSGGAVLLVGGAWWLFQPPLEAGAWYLFATLSATYLGWTLLAVPYYALGADIGRHNGQTRVAAWREAGMIVGTVAALLLPVAFSDRQALQVSAAGLAVMAPPAVLLAWRLRAAASTAGSAVASSLLAMWRQTSLAARQVLGIHLLNALAGGTAATLFVLYTRDVIGLDERASGALLLLYFVAGLAALPLWVVLARRFGQVATWRAAMLFAAIGFMPAALLGAGDHAAFVVVCILTGATLGADIAMPAAIQAQIVIDESTRLARPRGGALFGLWGMASKLALALSAGLALPLLAALSHPATGLARADVTPWLYAGLPALIKLVAVVALQRSVLFTEHTNAIAKETPDESITPVDAGRAADAARRL